MATVEYLGEQVAPSEDDADGRASTSRIFLFKSSTVKDGVELIANVTSAMVDLPEPKDEHPSHTGLTCSLRRVEPVVDSTGDVWRVICTYETPTPGGSGLRVSVSNNDDPWDLGPYDLRVYGKPYEFPFERGYKYTNLSPVITTTDAQGSPTVPVVNTAGDRFATVPTINRINVVFAFSYNAKRVASYNVAAWIDTVNDRKFSFFGATIQPGGARLNNLEMVYQKSTHKRNSYWRLSAEVELATNLLFRSDLESWGFRARRKDLDTKLYTVYMDNKGNYDILYDSDGARKFNGEDVFIDRSGNYYYVDGEDNVPLQQITDAVKLNADGEVIPGAVLFEEPSTFPAVSTFYQHYPKNWKSLGFPEKRLDSYK